MMRALAAIGRPKMQTARTKLAQNILAVLLAKFIDDEGADEGQRAITHEIVTDLFAEIGARDQTYFARQQGLDNVEWRAGDVYRTPFADGSFNIVTCRFAFHHFENPALAFAEMVRLAAPAGRVVVCDGLASEEPAKADAFNAMERRRDPSTVEFRTLPYLRRLFEAAGLGDPQVQRFDLSYLASDLVARSFPANDDRAGLLAMIESTVEGDKMDVGAHWTPGGVRFAFRSAVLSAVKPS